MRGAGFFTPYRILMRRVLIPSHISHDAPGASALIALHGETMGTTWSVQLLDPFDSGVNANRQQAWQLGIQRQLDTVVAQMSHWLDDSDLGRFNRAPAGSWHPLPEPFLHVLSYALRIAALSDGAYDPTAGTLVNAWGFGPHNRYDEAGFQPPDTAIVESALARSGWQRLSIDAHRVHQPGGLLLDLSSIAKGYGVDCVARHLENHGVAHYLVEVGGELRGAGMKPDQMPWWVELESPSANHADDLDTIVALHGLAVATSGDYRRFFLSDDDTRLAHSIDPRSGYPIRNGVASVTVLHPSCMEADALSTALTVLGVEDGLAFAEQHGLAARFLLRDGDGLADTVSERASSAFLAMLQ